MSSTWSQKLRKLHDQHNFKIVCDVEPHRGEEVEYVLRYPTDRNPWALKSKIQRDPNTGEVVGEIPYKYRFAGWACRAVTREGHGGK